MNILSRYVAVTIALVLLANYIHGEEELSEALDVVSPTSQLFTSTSSTTSTTQKSVPKSKVVSMITLRGKNEDSDNSKYYASDCPLECYCTLTKISCDDKKMKVIPNLTKYTNITDISLKSNLIEKVDFSQLPIGTLESLDLSSNTIKTFSNITKKLLEIPKLRVLNLRSNQLENLNGFSTWKFPSLESLDLSYNPIGEIGPISFNKTLNLQLLRIEQTKLKSVHELAFSSLGQLKSLNMSGIKFPSHLGDKQFEKNQKLEMIDLSENDLIEVPFALRSTSSVKELFLNTNFMTSLRQSDFINRTSLKYLEIKYCPNLTKIDELTFSKMDALVELHISDNPRLQYISKYAFKSDKRRELDVIVDISGNNLTTLADFREYITVDVIKLNNNPWNCNCDLKWIKTLPVAQRSLAHCKSPAQFKDLEISQYLLTTDCKVSDESDYRMVFLTILLIFLFGLSVITFVQKNEQCRRLFWKDQYGTIYYTKASFPPENA